MQCRADTDCSGSTPVCNENACVQCVANSDCSGATPVCTDNTCRGCGSNSDCSSGACQATTGTCIASTALLYTSPAGTVTDACTQDDPCALSHAFALAALGRNTISMGPGTYAETFTVSAGTNAIVFGNDAVIASAIAFLGSSQIDLEDLTLGSGFSCTGTSPTTMTTLSMEGVTLDELPFNGNDPVTYCDLSLLQTVQMGFVSAVGGTLALTNSKLEMDRSALSVLHVIDTGLPSQGTTVTITNSLVNVINKVSGDDIDINVSFSTFTNNPTLCVSATDSMAVEHFSNDIFSTKPDFVTAPTCFDHDLLNATGSAMVAPGLTEANIGFVDPTNGDFHLKAGSPAIDAADPAATDSVDYDGVSRPQGAGRDVGAFEFH